MYGEETIRDEETQGSAVSDDDGELISIKRIVRDYRYQVREKLDPHTVTKYIGIYAKGNEMDAARIVKAGTKLTLVDGWHRVAAQERIGRKKVKARVIEGTEKEARWMAAAANLHHGLPLKRAEMRNVFRAYVEAGQYKEANGKLKSYRQIATEIGGVISHTSVMN